jgi:hypothetical protein
MTLKQTTYLTVLTGVSIFVLNTDIFFSRLLHLDHAYLSQIPLPLGLVTNIILLTVCLISYLRATRKKEPYTTDDLLAIFLVIVAGFTYLVRIDEFNATLFRKATFLYKVITAFDKQNIYAAFLAQSTFIGLITYSIIKRINKTK